MRFVPQMRPMDKLPKEAPITYNVPGVSELPGVAPRGDPEPETRQRCVAPSTARIHPVGEGSASGAVTPGVRPESAP